MLITLPLPLISHDLQLPPKMPLQMLDWDLLKFSAHLFIFVYMSF